MCAQPAGAAAALWPVPATGLEPSHRRPGGACDQAAGSRGRAPIAAGWSATPSDVPCLAGNVANSVQEVGLDVTH